ncbi:acyl dehydratase [Litoreibacter roseus]|uniref:Mesaconyl-C(4)-CoA hydratase n=1 Tax=Litoreibacter roseus TaxID=2601869 RepID=A0A6N6JF64_9RHOB|nr:acyl dehydratase [Litoreibacter roseus]GFE64991.1 mesaconyl-C(4)-CoA hydratase [Litoreibacter roseus]
MDDALVLTDRIDAARIRALNTVLGLEDDVPHPFAHQVFFWDAQPTAELGRDGHPKTGGLIPDLGLLRRMWAGGRLAFHAPLKVDTPAEKRSRCLRSGLKEGKQGTLALVTLEHVIVQDGSTVITDEQDLVYLPDTPYSPRPAQLMPDGGTIAQTHTFTPTELFRYSALTFNGHRIHYDRDYAKDIEGYPGLVVHGPLLAQHLMLIAERTLGTLGRFEFRAIAPLFDGEEANFHLNETQDHLALWVSGPDGRLILQARAG